MTTLTGHRCFFLPKWPQPHPQLSSASKIDSSTHLTIQMQQLAPSILFEIREEHRIKHSLVTVGPLTPIHLQDSPVPCLEAARPRQQATGASLELRLVPRLLEQSQECSLWRVTWWGVCRCFLVSPFTSGHAATKHLLCPGLAGFPFDPSRPWCPPGVT